MNKTTQLTIGFFAMLGLVIGTAASSSALEVNNQYEVTVTNLTPKQTFTPILVASHEPGINLFTLGGPASEELAQLAEGGDTMPLGMQLREMDGVHEVTNSGAPLGPGETVVVTVSAAHGAGSVSLAAMLVPTNDAFVSLNDAKAPRGRRMLEYFSPVYDAGSEINSELCADIPAGATCEGEGYSPQGGEGFIHIHSGIHGTGELDSSVYDWHNPAARVTIRLISGTNGS